MMRDARESLPGQPTFRAFPEPVPEGATPPRRVDAMT
jgi:hypothetical protein